MSRRRGYTHRRRHPRPRTVAPIARECMVANRGAESIRNVVGLLAGYAVEEDKDFIAGRVRHDIIAAQIASNELDDLLAERGRLSVVRSGRSRCRRDDSIGVELYSQQRAGRATGGCGSDSRPRGGGKFVSRSR